MKTLIALLVIAGSYSKIFAQQPAIILSDTKGWHKIGESTVDFSKDKDEIMVMGADKFSSIKFEVTDAAIDLQDLEIYFENGPNQVVQVRTPLIAGHESKVINLDGGERAIKKISFVYKTLPNRKDEKAHVVVWGLKTNADKTQTKDMKNANEMQAKRIENHHDGDKGEMPKPAVVVSNASGWHEIGEMNVDFKNDHDEMKVIGKDRFKQIKLKAEDAAIELNDMDVYFENDNTPQRIHIGMILKEGEETKAMDLEGRNLPINKIVFMYKTAPNQERESAEIEIYGLK